MPKAKKQAVVLVHGIGEQRPMDTLREFVKSVWVKDDRLNNTRFWNKPSEVSGSFEHRRLTTDYAQLKNTANVSKTRRVDFFEYYWAHHTVGTTVEHLKHWLGTVLFRKPSDYPAPLKPIYYAVWCAFLVILGIVLFNVFVEPAHDENQSSHVALTRLLSSLAVLGLGFIVAKSVNYLGDVARYISASPHNIKVRQAIRQGGVSLLENIAATGKYDRIVLVGHSLGSVIAYDVLIQYWARSNKLKNAAGEPVALTSSALEIIHLMEALDSSNDADGYRAQQRKLFEQLQHDCKHASCHGHQPWLVSDLVTIGSPLTYADFLLFRNKQAFAHRKLDREYPTCPPVKEEQHYYYQTGDDKFLHHGALFAPVRWTNLYSQHVNIFGGDIISGPLATTFDNPQLNRDMCEKIDTETPITPLKDINVDIYFPGHFPRLFTHTRYWSWHKEFDKHGPPKHICDLRNSLDLLRPLD